jgi:hypothetical protein
MHDDIVTSSMSYKKEYNSKLGLIQYKRNVQLLIHASLIYHHKRKEKREEEEMKKKTGICTGRRILWCGHRCVFGWVAQGLQNRRFSPKTR